MNWLDRVIDWTAPAWGARRAHARSRRAAAELLGGYVQSVPERTDKPIFSRGTSPDWNLELGFDRRRLVDRARQLERDNVLAEALLSRSTEAVVGDGFRLRANSGDVKLDDEIEAAWEDWGEHDADARGLLTFSEIQAIVYRSKMRDGDVATVLVDDGARGSLRVVESDEVASPQGGHVKPSMVDGVELDRSGRPLRYWVFDWDPDVLWADRRVAIPRLVAVPADQVLFCARRTRAGQTRGVTAFTTLFWTLEQVEGLIEATTVAARVASCFGVLIKQHGPTLDLPQGPDGSGRKRQQLRLEPGIFKHLEPGEEVEQVRPEHPSQNLDAHLRNLIRLVGIPFGLPLEVVLRDFSQSNYSNTRAALLQAWHTWQRHQKDMKRYCSRVYLWWLLKEFPGLKAEQLAHEWHAPGWAWIDPVAEIQAALLAVDANLDSLTAVAARAGVDLDEVLEKRAAEVKRIKELDLPEVRSTLSRDPITPNTAPVAGAPGDTTGGSASPRSAPADR